MYKTISCVCIVVLIFAVALAHNRDNSQYLESKAKALEKLDAGEKLDHEELELLPLRLRLKYREQQCRKAAEIPLVVDSDSPASQTALERFLGADHQRFHVRNEATTSLRSYRRRPRLRETILSKSTEINSDH